MELSPDIGLAVWTLVSFLLLIGLLARFAFGPLRKALDEREALIRGSLEKSEEVRKQTEQLLTDGQAQLEQARKEARGIIGEGHKIVAVMKREAENAAKTEADLIVGQARAQIDAEVQKGLDELKGTVANLSVRIARQIVKGEIDDARHDQLVDDFIGRLKKSHAPTQQG